MWVKRYYVIIVYIDNIIGYTWVKSICDHLNSGDVVEIEKPTLKHSISLGYLVNYLT